MVTSKVAKRYAQGLLDFTQEARNTDAVFVEMKDIAGTISNSKDLQNFFASPIVDSKKKIAAAAAIFKNFSPVANNIIAMVIKHGREGSLQDIAQAYINKVEDMRGVQRISITSATQLSPENIKNILTSTHLVNHNNQFDVKTNIKPEILGGYILRVGDQQLDQSVKAKLAKLKKQFELN